MCKCSNETVPTIKVKYLDPEGTRLQKIAKGDWIDLYAAADVEIPQFGFKLIPLGVVIKLPEGYEGHLAPRSSTYKNFGIIQTNSVGVVDETYCGPTDQWFFPALAMRDTVIKKGDKICQFRIMKKMPEETELVEIEEVTDADRGGIGSTGTR